MDPSYLVVDCTIRGTITLCRFLGAAAGRRSVTVNQGFPDLRFCFPGAEGSFYRWQFRRVVVRRMSDSRLTTALPIVLILPDTCLICLVYYPGKSAK
jgi:hypothetical protein